MFRPHLSFVTPAGYRDELAEFPFYGPQAGGFVFTTRPILDQPLRLDEDAEFWWRSIYWEFPDTAQLLTGGLAMRIRDPWGNYLSSDYIPVLNYIGGYYTLQPWGPVTPPTGPNYITPVSGGMGVPFPDEIRCPASSVVQIDMIGLNVGTENNTGRLLARGVKRRLITDCGGVAA